MLDVTDATFATDVIERSNSVPVVVDLWAEWCGPCKTLGPILEKVIGETDGLVELAKVDVDANQEVSAAFKVQSIPAVYAMRNGQVIDGFMGAVGEPEVVAFVQRLLDAEVVPASATEEPDVADGAESVGPVEQVDAPQIVDAPGQATSDGQAPAPSAPAATPAEVAAIEAELETLLLTVKTDDSHRERYLELLERMGSDHPETNTWRRRLATAIF